MDASPTSTPPNAPVQRDRSVEDAAVSGESPGAPIRRRYHVEGLCCATEARQIETTLAGDARVEAFHVDPVGHTLDVTGSLSPRDVREALVSLGMDARPADEAAPEPSGWDRHGPTVLVVVSGVLFLATLLTGALGGPEPVALALAVGAVVSGGWRVFPRGARAALNRALDMNFLMSVAALGALAIGEHAEAASVMFLFALAQLLEARSMDRARGAIRSLMDLSPPEATILSEGREMRIATESIVPGDVVLVRPGERIPVDGRVLAGRSAVDQAPVTGEPVPVDVEPGAEVWAGTVNGQGALELRATAPARDSTVARIVHAIEDARATRAPSQTFVERFARVYTPAVVAAAVALAVLPPLLGFGPSTGTAGAWGEWFYRALALLVVACPCALVISTPVTVVSALAGGARRGILVKGGLHLENAGRARVVALDKTGTLTEGRSEVVDVLTVEEGGDPADVLALAAGAEARSEHPLARAVVRRAEADGVEPMAVSETLALAGLGVEGRVGTGTVLVGSPRLFADRGVDLGPLRERIDALEARGHTVAVCGRAETPDATPRPVGLLIFADRLRPGAAASLGRLRRTGIDRLVILTGDAPGSTAALAEALGDAVDEVRAGLLPTDKADAVRALRERWGPVLMVGDGINDGPALAAADVGVAMGAVGTDVALETADAALMSDDLDRLATLVRLARKAEGIIRANIAFALVVKAVFVVLAVTGVATLWMAVLADMGASLAVIANGMRSLRVAEESPA